MPRGNEFIEGLYRYQPPYDDNRTHYVYGMGENSAGLQSGLIAKMDHPETEYETHEDIEDRDLERARWRDADRVWHDPDSRQFSKAVFPDEENGQGVLFGVSHRPPKIDYMAGTKDASRAGIAKILGLAAQDAQLRWGEPPQPSDNLSNHSAPVVNKLISAGLIRGRETDEHIGVGNDMSWRSGQHAAEEIKDDFAGHTGYGRSYIEKVSDQEANTAEANLIATLRAAKKDPNAIPRQWRDMQPTLPGFENKQ